MPKCRVTKTNLARNLGGPSRREEPVHLGSSLKLLDAHADGVALRAMWQPRQFMLEPQEGHTPGKPESDAED